MEIRHDIHKEGCDKCIMIVQYDISRRSGVATDDTQNVTPKAQVAATVLL